MLYVLQCSNPCACVLILPAAAALSFRRYSALCTLNYNSLDLISICSFFESWCAYSHLASNKVYLLPTKERALALPANQENIHVTANIFLSLVQHSLKPSRRVATSVCLHLAMYIKTLTIQGFKSCMSTHSLHSLLLTCVRR